MKLALQQGLKMVAEQPQTPVPRHSWLIAWLLEPLRATSFYGGQAASLAIGGERHQEGAVLAGASEGLHQPPRHERRALSLDAGANLAGRKGALGLHLLLDSRVIEAEKVEVDALAGDIAVRREPEHGPAVAVVQRPGHVVHALQLQPSRLARGSDETHQAIKPGPDIGAGPVVVEAEAVLILESRLKPS